MILKFINHEEQAQNPEYVVETKSYSIYERYYSNTSEVWEWMNEQVGQTAFCPFAIRQPSNTERQSLALLFMIDGPDPILITDASVFIMNDEGRTIDTKHTSPE